MYINLYVISASNRVMHRPDSKKVFIRISTPIVLLPTLRKNIKKMKFRKYTLELTYLAAFVVFLYFILIQTKSVTKYGSISSSGYKTTSPPSLRLNIVINLFDEDLSWLKSICYDFEQFNTSIYIYLQHNTRYVSNHMYLLINIRSLIHSLPKRL